MSDEFVKEVRDLPAEDRSAGAGIAEGRLGPAHRGAPRGRHGRRPSRRSGRGRGRFGKKLAVSAAVVVVLVGTALFWADSQINPGGHPGRLVSVSIPRGASTSKIGSILSDAGVVHEGTLFALYVRLHGDGPLYPGQYDLPRNSSYRSAIAALEAGPKILVDHLVVPEGFTIRQIAEAVGALPGLGLSAQRFMVAATDGSVRSPYEPPGVNDLEGLLFPATYDIKKGQSETDILEQLIGSFNDHASALGLSSAASALGYTPYQAVTVASIVERESKRDDDRAPVASVIYNRLRVGMPLGADSTQTYYMRLTDPAVQPTARQLNAPSPYNTRLNKGLPPTPIANVGIPSLQAAVAPAATNYLYFVEINPDGRLGFASTSAGFVQLQNQCRAAKLC